MQENSNKNTIDLLLVWTWCEVPKTYEQMPLIPGLGEVLSLCSAPLVFAAGHCSGYIHWATARPHGRDLGALGPWVMLTAACSGICPLLPNCSSLVHVNEAKT